MQPGPSLIPDSIPRFPLHPTPSLPLPRSSQLCSTCLTNHCCRTSDRRLHTQPDRLPGEGELCVLVLFFVKAFPLRDALLCAPPALSFPPSSAPSLKLTALLGGVGVTSQQTLPFPACGSMEGSLQHTAASPSLVKAAFVPSARGQLLCLPQTKATAGQGRQGNAQENDAQQNALWKPVASPRSEGFICYCSSRHWNQSIKILSKIL